MDRGKRILNLALAAAVAQESTLPLQPFPIVATDISKVCGSLSRNDKENFESESSESGEYSDDDPEYKISDNSTSSSNSSSKNKKRKTYHVLSAMMVNESSDFNTKPGPSKEINHVSTTKSANEFPLESVNELRSISTNELFTVSGIELSLVPENDLISEPTTEFILQPENELTSEPANELLPELAYEPIPEQGRELNSEPPSEPIAEPENGLTLEPANEPMQEFATKNRKRGKFANPNNWEKNKRKDKVTKGETHTSKSGKIIPDKTVLPIDCSKCRLKCCDTFTNDDRIKINRQYWGLGNADKKRAYLNALITEMNKACTRTTSEKSRRTKTRHFFLPKGEEKKKIRVCQKFFLATFHVSNSVIDSVVHKRNEQYVVEEDKRGRHEPVNKRTPAAVESIISHIEKFPRIPSHYTRKDTQREYLPSDLNLQKMYDLYCEECEKSNTQPEKLWLYRHVFHTKFNLSFHHPKKDICDKCYLFNSMDEEEKNKNRIDHNNHIERKILARSKKEEFKQKASNNEIHFFQFDMEAVRYCPQVRAKAIFYKRRLAVYNLTCYNVATKKAINYMWHEGTAGRGAAEVASCLYMNLFNHQDGKEIALMSDTCGGQNRNSVVTAMFMLSVQVLNIPKIDHIFFEPGHSQMECDSVHAQIERTAKDMEIFDPSGWFAVVRMSSKSKHYEVKEVNQTEVLNFKMLSNAAIKNKKVDLNGNNVRWLDIVWLQYRKDDPLHVYFKYDYREEFKMFKIQRRPIRGFTWDAIELERKYNGPLAIQTEKYQDLMELCSGIIPQNYRFFYESLQEEGNEERRGIEEEVQDDHELN